MGEKRRIMFHAALLGATIAFNDASASHGRYHGAPDLTITAQMLRAGGAPHFSSYKLFVYLAGPLAAAEGQSLAARFGAYTLAQFFQTFDEFVHLAAIQVQKNHIALPASSAKSAPALARELYRAGIMPDHRYDVGYMLEHLLSRPMHVTLMHEVNENPAYGATKNASFHVILTAAMHDLHKVYGD
jgi:hypothetical protein